MFSKSISVFASAGVATSIAALAVAVGSGTAMGTSIPSVNFQLGSPLSWSSSLSVYSGTGAAPDTGTYWNYSRYGSGAGGIGQSAVNYDSSGTYVPLGFTVSQLPYTSTTTLTPNGLLDNFISGWLASSSSYSFQLYGNYLNPNYKYDIYLYGMGGYAAPKENGTAFTIGSTTLSTTGANSGATATSIPTSDKGVSYVEFTDVTPTWNSSGNDYVINGTFTSNTTSASAVPFNGLQLVTVATPEPTAIDILAFGGILGLLMISPGWLYSKKLGILRG